jgi:hypothetical protein
MAEALLAIVRASFVDGALDDIIGTSESEIYDKDTVNA